MPDVADLSLKKLPPFHEEAERYVLGSCLDAGEAIARALEIIESADFYKTGHRKIFTAMQDLFADNQPIDVLTLAERLRKKDELENIGGMDYLSHLESLAPTAAVK